MWMFCEGVPREFLVFLRQAAQVVFEDLEPFVSDMEKLSDSAYAKLVRELGHGLYRGQTARETCIGALCEQYDLWNNAHGPPYEFVAYRISLLELLLAEVQSEFLKPPSTGIRTPLKKLTPSSVPTPDTRHEKLRDAIGEINHRLRDGRIQLHLHNGLFQRGSDELSEMRLREPFWVLLRDPKWHNVDIDMKEALDRYDANERDVALYALKALESAIKIISDEKGWTRGNERGAAHYIDNLVSSANGNFIAAREGDQLKSLFRDIRNPHGHGPGANPQPALSKHQECWAIECAMIWIKSLVGR